MFFTNQRLKERESANVIIKDLLANQRQVNVIHYSCESFYQTNGNTPRVTAICVKNVYSNSSALFSIHLQAQLTGKDICCLTQQDFDFLEKGMLDSFYKYVKTHKTSKWVHWNMANSVYGFDAIANRYKILGGKPVDIESQFRYDLSNIIPNLYSIEYEEKANRGRLLNLATRNNINDKDALTGSQEADAFNQRKYLKLSMSTSRKVDIIYHILNKVLNGGLKVKTPLYKIYGLSIPGIIEIVKNNWILSLVASVLLFVLGVILEGPVKSLFGIQ